MLLYYQCLCCHYFVVKQILQLFCCLCWRSVYLIIPLLNHGTFKRSQTLQFCIYFYTWVLCSIRPKLMVPKYLLAKLNLSILTFCSIRQKFMVPKYLWAKIKLEYSDILYNPTHFPVPFVCWIRQVPLYLLFLVKDTFSYIITVYNK